MSDKTLIVKVALLDERTLSSATASSCKNKFGDSDSDNIPAMVAERNDHDLLQAEAAVNNPGTPSGSLITDIPIKTAEPLQLQPVDDSPAAAKDISFAGVGEVDLKITIGGISALVVSGVVFQFSPVLRYMCTGKLVGENSTVLNGSKYTPAQLSSSFGDSRVAVLAIDSQECWATDNGEAVTAVFHAMHGNATRIQHRIELALLSRITEFSCAYSCRELMVPWVRIWLDNSYVHERLYQTLIYEDEVDEQLQLMCSLLTVAAAFKDSVALKYLLRLCLLSMPGHWRFTEELEQEGVSIRMLIQFRGTRYSSPR